jgi:hypothetical protein
MRVRSTRVKMVRIIPRLLVDNIVMVEGVLSESDAMLLCVIRLELM